MRCAYCGTEIEIGSSYCPHCGKEVQFVSDTSVFEDDILQSMLEEENDPLLTKKAGHSSSNHTAATSQGQAAGHTNVNGNSNIEPISNTHTNAIAKARQQREELQKKESPAKNKKKEKRLNIILILFSILAVAAVIIAIKLKIDYDHAHQFSYQYEKGEEAEKIGNRSEALHYYEKALALKQSDIEVRFRLADLYEKKQQDDKTIQMLEEIIALDKNKTQAYEKLIQIYDKKKDYKSIIALQKVADPDDTDTQDLFNDYIVEAPEFTVKEGTYNEDFQVVIEADVGCEVYYSMDGSSPEKNGLLYNGGIPLEKEGVYTIQAVAKDERGIYSDIVTVHYTIDYDAPDRSPMKDLDKSASE